MENKGFFFDANMYFDLQVPNQMSISVDRHQKTPIILGIIGDFAVCCVVRALTLIKTTSFWTFSTFFLATVIALSSVFRDSENFTDWRDNILEFLYLQNKNPVFISVRRCRKHKSKPCCEPMCTCFASPASSCKRWPRACVPCLHREGWPHISKYWIVIKLVTGLF